MTMASHTDLTYNDLIQWLRSLTGASKQHRAIGRDGVMVARTRNGELMRLLHHGGPDAEWTLCTDRCVIFSTGHHRAAGDMHTYRVRSIRAALDNYYPPEMLTGLPS
jgi:hypothetical protein